MKISARLSPGVSSTELLVAVFASVGAVALVTAAIALLNTWAPVLSLGVLYVFAVLPVAIVWGLAFAIPTAVASMLAFNFFFLPPTHTFTLSQSENWFALAVYVVVAVAASELAVRARRRARLAEQREREAALLATVATSLLRGEPVHAELDRISARVAEVLHVAHARIALEPPESEPGLDARPLSVGDRHVGTLLTSPEASFEAAAETRFLPALASLLAVGADRDELQRELLETEAVRRADAVKTAVLRAVSHDLRSPLTAIAAAASGLDNPTLELADEDRAALVETIRVEAARLDGLVADLIDLSRLQAGAASPSRALWEVDDLVGLALDDVHDDRVTASIPADLPAVVVDAAQIRRVLANVLENALQVSPPGAGVRVSAERSGDEVLVSVSDRGPGIADAERDAIFRPFQRGSAGGSYRGSGLGLAIARGFAEANGGRLWAESTPAGATISLSLPGVASGGEAPS